MAISKSLFLILLVISSLAAVGNSQAIGGGGSLPCIQKLMPCQPYLKGSPPPPPPCCVPLKQMVAGDTQCLCAVFKNEAILKGLNVTQKEALHLVKTCGANDDISVCNQEAVPPSLPSAPSANSPETNAPAPKNSAAMRVSHVVEFLLPAAAIYYLFFMF